MHGAQQSAELFLGIGVIFLIGWVAEEVGRRWSIPRVSTMVLAGVVAGPQVLAIIPAQSSALYDYAATIALSMVGFLVGGSLTRRALRAGGFSIFLYSLIISVITAVIVFAGLRLFDVPVVLALLLAGISTSTDPAATFDVVRSFKKPGPLGDTLKVLVALDDVWGILFFALALVGCGIATTGAAAEGVLLTSLTDIGGAVVLGIAVGIPMAFLSGRVRPGEPMVAEALGMVFLCTGLALWFSVSYLLACMVLGCVVANLARHHERPLRSIEGIEWPFLILFFVLSGAALDVSVLVELKVVGIAYIVLRFVGRWLGGWPGRWLLPSIRFVSHAGIGLLPQAGVALGMALVAAEIYPEHAQTLITVVISAAVFFELVGPIAARTVLRRSANSLAASGKSLP